MSRAMPATSAAGVVPSHTKCMAKPATPPSRTSRATRAAGQRSTPLTPRFHTGKRAGPVPRRRTHGRMRGSSMAS